MLVIGLTVALLASVFYNLKLIRRLKAYEHVWEQIEQVADHNQDGTFTINIQHLEEQHPLEHMEAHSPISYPSLHIMDVPELSVGANDTPPRAA